VASMRLGASQIGKSTMGRERGDLLGREELNKGKQLKKKGRMSKKEEGAEKVGIGRDGPFSILKREGGARLEEGRRKRDRTEKKKRCEQEQAERRGGTRKKSGLFDPQFFSLTTGGLTILKEGSAHKTTGKSGRESPTGPAEKGR